MASDLASVVDAFSAMSTDFVWLRIRPLFRVAAGAVRGLYTLSRRSRSSSLILAGSHIILIWKELVIPYIPQSDKKDTISCIRCHYHPARGKLAEIAPISCPSLFSYFCGISFVQLITRVAISHLNSGATFFSS